MPFPAIQVDGGSEADFEHECQQRGLFELPPRFPELNGHVERDNGTWRYEFYATWDLPNDDLEDITGGPSPMSSTPSEPTKHLTGKPPPNTFNLSRPRIPPTVSYVVN